MMRANKVVSMLILVCLLFNTAVSDLAFGQMLNYRSSVDNLATPSGLNDIVGIQHKDMGRIKLALEEQLVALIHSGLPVNIDTFQTIVKERNPKENTIFQPADMQFFFHEIKLTNAGLCVMVRLKDKYGLRTYYATFSLQRDENDGFPVAVYTEEQHKGTLGFTKGMPQTKTEDAKAIERYIQHEKGVDAVIRYAHEQGLAKEPITKRFDYSRFVERILSENGIKVTNPDGLIPIEGRRFYLVKLTKEIQDMISANPAVVIDAEGIEHTVPYYAHSSNDAMHVFVKEEAFEALTNPKYAVIEPERNTTYQSALVEIGNKLDYEIGVPLGFPVTVDGAGKLWNELNRRSVVGDNEKREFQAKPLEVAIVDLDHVKGRDYAAGAHNVEAVKFSVSPEIIAFFKDLRGLGHAISLDGFLPNEFNADPTRKRRWILQDLIDAGVFTSATTNNSIMFNILKSMAGTTLSPEDFKAMFLGNTGVDLQGKDMKLNPLVGRLVQAMMQNHALREASNEEDLLKTTYNTANEVDVAGLMGAALLPVWEATKHRHGHISVEPFTETVEKEAVDQIVSECIAKVGRIRRQISTMTGRPADSINNIFTKLPVTPNGLEAGKILISRGYNVNFTLIATLDQYRAVIKMWKEGVKIFVENAWKRIVEEGDQSSPQESRIQEFAQYVSENLPQSVASIFVSRDDRNVVSILSDKTFGKILEHLEMRLKNAEPLHRKKIEQKIAYYKDLVTLPARAQEKKGVLARFERLLGHGPENTSQIALAFAKAEAWGVFQQEFEQDAGWLGFIGQYKLPAELMPQQIYWASTGVKVGKDYTTNPFYMEGLVSPNTTDTVPNAVIYAIAQGSTAPFKPQVNIDKGLAECNEALQELTELGIDLNLIKKEIIFKEGVKDFAGSDKASLDVIKQQLEAARAIVKMVEEAPAAPSSVQPSGAAPAQAVTSEVAGLTRGMPAPGSAIPVDTAGTIRKQDVGRTVQNEITAAITMASEAGLQIPTHPSERYNLLVTSEFFANGELKEHRAKYGDRFDLDRVSGRSPEQFVDNILAKASGKETKTIALVPNDLPAEQLGRLAKIGIRFVRVNTTDLQKAKTDKDANREKFQIDTYTMMLLLRRIDNSMIVDSSIYRLLSFYLRSHFTLSDKIAIDDYIMAIINNDITKLIKGLLAYRPAQPYEAPNYNNVAASLISA